jgi:hypothetical protein
MPHNERNSPNAPESSRFRHFEAPWPFSHNKVSLASSSYLRTPACKSSRLGTAHPYLPLPTSSQRHCGIRSIALRQRDATPHLRCSRRSCAVWQANRKIISALAQALVSVELERGVEWFSWLEYSMAYDMGEPVIPEAL